MAYSDLMVPSSVVVRRPAVGEKAEDFKRKLEEEFEAKESGLAEASRPEPALVSVKEAVTRLWTQRTSISPKAGWNAGIRQLGFGFSRC